MTPNLSKMLDREFEEREKIGEIRGEKIGELKGIRKILTTQLNQKFPNLPSHYNDKVQKADISVIEKIAKDIFIISNLEELDKYLN